MVYAGGETSEVVINGGMFTYTGTNAKQRGICAEYGAKVTMNGGAFEFDPFAFVAEGYEAVQGADGWWTVSAK